MRNARPADNPCLLGGKISRCLVHQRLWVDCNGPSFFVCEMAAAAYLRSLQAEVEGEDADGPAAALQERLSLVHLHMGACDRSVALSFACHTSQHADHAREDGKAAEQLAGSGEEGLTEEDVPIVDAAPFPCVVATLGRALIPPDATEQVESEVGLSPVMVHQVHGALQQEKDMEAQAGEEKIGSAVERSASASVSVSAQQVCARLSGADAQGQERSKRERRKTDFFNPEMTCRMEDAPPLPPSASSAPAPAAVMREGEAREGEASKRGDWENDIDVWMACGKCRAAHKALAYCVAAGHAQHPRFEEEDGEQKGKGGSWDADGGGGQGSSRQSPLVGRQVHKFFKRHGWFEVCVCKPLACLYLLFVRPGVCCALPTHTHALTH
jgi:hypothetical protein